VSDWDGIPEHWGWGHYRDVPVCKLVLTARKRHIEDLKRSLANDPAFPYRYDDEKADRVVKFFSLLRHIDGEWKGKRFVLADWQEWDIIRPLFGWVHKETGIRRFRTAYIEIPRKNAKSTLCAGIAAYGLLADGEYRGQVYSAGTKEDQAMIVWEMTRDLINSSPELREYITVFKKSLYCPRLGSKFKPLGRDSRTQDGFSVHIAVLDEYHAHRTTGMLDVLSSGRGSRRQPLIVIITTAGFGTHSPCKKESDLAKRVVNGMVQNDRYFGYITTVDDPKKWDDPVEWQKANPNFGISIYEDGFKSDFDEARSSPERQNGFKTKMLNIWTEQASRWISMAQYAKCGGPIDWDKLKGRLCYGGLDLGISRDLSALILAFMEEKPKLTLVEPGQLLLPKVYLLARFWVPADTIHERSKLEGVPYAQWADEGLITTTPGNSTRYDIIRRDINELRDIYEIAELAVDRAHAHQLMTELADDGLTIFKHSQNMMAMNMPCRSLEELILQERLQHGDNPVLEWQFSNAAIARDGNENIKVVKDKSGDRVDGVVAGAMAVGRLLAAPEPQAFVYDDMGMFVAGAKG
jgi:phage terminase large subunit-like protein